MKYVFNERLEHTYFEYNVPLYYYKTYASLIFQTVLFELLLRKYSITLLFLKEFEKQAKDLIKLMFSIRA